MTFDSIIQKEITNSMFQDQIIRIIRKLLVRLYGALGHHEFIIEDIEYDEASNTWIIRLTRQVDGLTLHYEATIDNETGQPIAFGRREY
jgi:hypothetical protein